MTTIDRGEKNTRWDIACKVSYKLFDFVLKANKDGLKG